MAPSYVKPAASIGGTRVKGSPYTSRLGGRLSEVGEELDSNGTSTLAPEPSPPVGNKASGALARPQGRKYNCADRDQDDKFKDEAAKEPTPTVLSKALAQRSNGTERPAPSGIAQRPGAPGRPALGQTASAPRAPAAIGRNMPNQSSRPVSTQGTASVLAESGAQGHAAGTVTLSLREKVVFLQKQNRVLEEKLLAAESKSEAHAAIGATAATASTTASAEDHQAAALAQLAQQVATLEAALLVAHQKNNDLVAQAATLAAELQQQHRFGSGFLDSVGPSTPSDDGNQVRLPLADAQFSGSSFASQSEFALAVVTAAEAALECVPQLSPLGLRTTLMDDIIIHSPTTPSGSPPSAPGTPTSTPSPSLAARTSSPAGRMQPVAPPPRTTSATGQRPNPSVNRQRSGADGTCSMGQQPSTTDLSAPASPALSNAAFAPPFDLATTVASATAAAVAEALAASNKVALQLRTQLLQANSAIEFLRKEHAEVEALQKDTETQRREFAARYAFCVLDDDNDGYILSTQIQVFDLFQPYSSQTIDLALKHWKYASGFKGYFTMEDFLRFVTLADERTTRDSQRFWFNVIDVDGDGRISCEDAKCFYDAVPKGEGFVVSFEDLWYQLVDMVKPAVPCRGFTAAELWRCKLGAGALGLLTNHNNMLLQRSTAEWGRGDYPL